MIKSYIYIWCDEYYSYHYHYSVLTCCWNPRTYTNGPWHSSVKSIRRKMFLYTPYMSTLTIPLVESGLRCNSTGYCPIGKWALASFDTVRINSGVFTKRESWLEIKSSIENVGILIGKTMVGVHIKPNTQNHLCECDRLSSQYEVMQPLTRISLSYDFMIVISWLEVCIMVQVCL